MQRQIVGFISPPEEKLRRNRGVRVRLIKQPQGCCRVVVNVGKVRQSCRRCWHVSRRCQCAFADTINKPCQRRTIPRNLKYVTVRVWRYS